MTSSTSSSSPHIPATEILSLQAFLVALAQLDMGLPPLLHQQIHELGEQLAQSSQAIAQIPALVNQCDRLRELYEAQSQELQRRYENQGQPLDVAIATGPSTSGAIWSQAVAQTLTSNNPVSAARTMVKQATSRVTASPSFREIASFLVPLFRTAQAIKSEENAVLRALEYRPLTIEDLAYTLGVSIDRVQTILHALWEAGYVDTNSGQLLYRIFPFLNSPRQIDAAIDPDMAFTLTMRGHFRLHPLVRNDSPKVSLS